MQKVAVCINQKRLLESLRYAFTNRYTVVTELMQNARRANASYVAVDYDGQTNTLCVRDDGIGIIDWQKLFTIGESGWEEAVARDEHAFGVGFTKCLYSARRCTVRSRGRMIAFDTLSALRQLPIEVRVAVENTETSVTLDGVLLPGFEQRIEALASAFPIEVICNGKVLPRPLAIRAKRYVATPVGAVHLAGAEDGRAAASAVLVLQGFAVCGDAFEREGNVVHLDARRFHARLPDRDVLVDEAEVVQQVEAVLKSLWRERLEQAKRSLPGDAFVARFFAAALTWGASDLFADVGWLPGRLFARIVGYPIQEGYRQPEYLQALSGLVQREQFARGELRAVMLPPTDRDCFPFWMFAKSKGLLILTSPWAVAEGHWLWDYVRALDDQPVDVTIVGEKVRSTLDGQWVAPEVVLCEAYRVCIAGDVAELTDHAMAWSGASAAEDLILVPDGEHGGAAVLQCSSYLDADDRWRAESADQDRDALASLIRRLRAQDPADAMRSLIGELRLENYPDLKGRTFSLQVGQANGMHEVRLVD